MLLLCLAVLLTPSARLPLADKVDESLFALGALLQREPIDTKPYVRIDVPSREIQRFLHDPASAIDMMNMLEQLQQTFTRGTAFVLREPVWRQYAAQDFLIAHWHDVSTGSQPETEKNLADINARMRIFISVLANPKYVFAMQQDARFVAHAWQLDFLQNGPSGLKNLLQPPLPVAAISPIDKMESASPLAGITELGRPLLWQADDLLRPDARLELFMHQQGLHAPAWLAGQGFQWPDHTLRTSFNAVVYPRFTAGSAAAPALQHYNLQQLATQDVRRLLHEKTVVIAEQGDLVADDMLYSVLSLEGGYYAVAPEWLPLFRIGVILVIMLLAVSSHYSSKRLFSILNLLVLASLLLTQQIFLLLHREWLPIAACVLLLLGCYLTILLWEIRRQYYPLATGDLSRKSSLAHVADNTASVPVPLSRPDKIRPSGPSLFARIFKKSSSNSNKRNRYLDDDEATLFDTGAMEKTARLTTAAPPPRKQRQFLGRYQVQRELGRGAMGVVYLGFDPKIARQVAIKTLHYTQFDSSELASVKERFFREAEAAGRLRHPNIVTIYDAGEESDLAYIAMDYVSGNSLAAHIRKDQLLDVELVYWIMMNVADAVAYANSQGIIHRDIKPSNILFDAKTNEVKVADFGIARIMDSTVSRTKTGDILGSPLYMAPEQLKGEPVSPRSDVFSLGVTFYQLLTGELPFKGNNIHELSLQIVQAKFRSVDEVRPGLPDSARLIINKALQKNPDKRYNTAAEMAEALNRAYSKEFT